MTKRKKRLLIAGIVAGVVCCVTLTTLTFGHRVRQKTDEAMALVQTVDQEDVKEMKNENISEETTVKLRDHWTIAAFGLDSRDKDNLKNGNSDVILLIDMDGKSGAVKMVSVYRDTCLDIGNGKYRKANAAYANGGPKQAVRMLNENMDIEIDDYIAVTWKSVADAINLLGGVDVEITKSEFRYINGFITETVKSTGVASYHLKEPGMQHLDGVQAVAYCRLRLMDSDFKRTERQQRVLKLVLEKAKKSDMITLNALIQTVFPQTASSIETDDLFALMKNVLKLHVTESGGFPTKYVCERSGGADYVFPDDLEENVSALHEFLYGTKDYEPSSHVKFVSEAVEQKRRGSSNSTKKQPETEQQTEYESEREIQEETAPQNTESESENAETQPETQEETPIESTTPEKMGPGIVTETEPQPLPEANTELDDGGNWEWEGDTLKYT